MATDATTSTKLCFRPISFLALLTVTWTIGTHPASGQQLLTLGPHATENNSVAGPEAPAGQLQLPRPRVVRVNLDLLRAAPPQLHLPTLDGEVLVAQLTAFEDRGGGDLLWSGHFPGTDYDSVVLTVAGGALLGHFEEPLGRKYRIAAASDGTGTMRDTRALQGESDQRLCGVGMEPTTPLHEHLLADGRRRDSRLLRPVDSAVNDSEFKILVLYTRTLEAEWNNPDSHLYSGNTSAALQNAADYLTMALRTAAVPILPSFAYDLAPPWHDSYNRDEFSSYRHSDPFWLFQADGEVELLKRRHSADLVHLFYYERVRRHPYGGKAQLYQGSSPFSTSRGVTANGNSVTFAHEIGHNLGGHHQPGVGGSPSPPDARRNVDQGAPVWTAFAFAHGWNSVGTPTPHGATSEYGTILSYVTSTREPYFSTPRRSLRGINLGVHDERDNEQTFQITVQDIANQNLFDQANPRSPSLLERARRPDGSPSNLRFRWKNNDPAADGTLVTVISNRDQSRVWTDELPSSTNEVQLDPLEPGGYLVKLESFIRDSGEPSGARWSVPTLIGWFIGYGPQNTQRPETIPNNLSVSVLDFDYGSWIADMTWTENLTAEEAMHSDSRAEIRIYRGSARDGDIWEDEDYLYREFVDAGERHFGHVLPKHDEPYTFLVAMHTFRGISHFRALEQRVPPVDPDASDLDEKPGGAEGCPRHVTPYWEGTGGFVVRARNGEYVDMTVRCGGQAVTDTVYADDDGLIVSLLRPAACSSNGRPVQGTIEFRGITDGGWYWVNGSRNTAAAPLICYSQLDGERPVVPPGVKATVGDQGTLFRHDTSRLIGIVPNLRSGSGTLLAPFWHGTGGIVGRARNGRSVTVRVRCGGVERSDTLLAQADGMVVELLRYSFCIGNGGRRLAGSMEVDGMEPGGWYWINGDRNAAVAPLMSVDRFGGAPPVVPGGVGAAENEYGTLFTHEAAGLIAIVPRVRGNR